MTEIDPVALASATGIAVGLTALIKDAVGKLPSRVVPLIAVGTGFGLALLWLAAGVSDGESIGLSHVVAALTAAFAAVGVHQGVVHTANGR
tara:strand:- start:557 stop:829 length:273 start_codon:yes stop_codon:yes gene_type:complete